MALLLPSYPWAVIRPKRGFPDSLGRTRSSLNGMSRTGRSPHASRCELVSPAVPCWTNPEFPVRCQMIWSEMRRPAQSLAAIGLLLEITPF